jgi:hypothetical protein
MIEDDVLREVRAAREAFARSHNYDVRAMVAKLRELDLAGDWPVVRRASRAPVLTAPPPNAQQPNERQPAVNGGPGALRGEGP